MIDLPELAGFFGPGSKAEVAVAGRIALGQRTIDVAGQVDRIGEEAGDILLADYKTGTPCGLDDDPRRAISPNWPSIVPFWRHSGQTKPLRMLLIWTQGPLVVSVPPSALMRLWLLSRRAQRLTSKRFRPKS